MLRASIVALVLAVVLAPSVIAADRLDRNFCLTGTFNVLFSDKELTLLSVDYMGVIPSKGSTPTLGASIHCTGINEIVGKKAEFHGICKEVDTSGNVLLSDVTGHGSGGTFSYLGGTGSWSGVKGSGEYTVTEREKPAEKGTFGQCIHATGSYTVAMKK